MDKILEKIKDIQTPEEGFAFIEYENFYWGYDSDKNISFGLKSNDKSEQALFQSTQYLKFAYNTKFEILFNGEKRIEKIHVITLKSSESRIIETFISLSLAFRHNADDKKLLKFFSDIKDIFTIKDKKGIATLQGLYGELYAILYFYDNFDFDLTKYYQSNQTMKFDFSLTETKKIEIKSSINPIRLHTFSLNQLNTEKFNILIISILLSDDDQGYSLLDLINTYNQKFANNYLFLARIQKIIAKWEKEELQKIKFNIETARDSLACFFADRIPRITEKIQEGVFNVVFQSDLTGAQKLSRYQIENWLKEE